MGSYSRKKVTKGSDFMNRFFIDRELIKASQAVIYGDDVQHISKVLRLREGQRINLCDKVGLDYIAEIQSVSNKLVELNIIDKYPSKGEAKINTVLYQGIPKSTKMDLIIQKSTEMGIKKIVPVTTLRSIVKFESEKDIKKKVERWSKIAEEAAKQSKRGIIPHIEKPMTLEKAIEDAKNLDISLVAYEQEEYNSIKATLNKHTPASIGFFVGPEGGFEASEIDNATKNGILSVSLGNRILRTETAGLAILTSIMYEYGEMD